MTTTIPYDITHAQNVQGIEMKALAKGIARYSLKAMRLMIALAIVAVVYGGRSVYRIAYDWAETMTDMCFSDWFMDRLMRLVYILGIATAITQVYVLMK